MKQLTHKRPGHAHFAAIVTACMTVLGSLEIASALPAASAVQTASGQSAQASEPLDIVGVSIEGERVVLRSSGRMGSITAAPVEQDRSVILILGHRPGAALAQSTSSASGLVETVELRTETTTSSVFTKVLIKTRSPARASVSTTQNSATIVMEPTQDPLILPPREDLFPEEEISPSPDREGLRIRTVAAVYLREGPGQRYGTVSVADVDQVGEVIGIEGSWRWLQLDSGDQGWVHQDFVQLDQDSLELEVPAEVGTTTVGSPERPVTPPRETPRRQPASATTIEDRVQALLGAFEDERSDLQDRLTTALKEADKLRTERYSLEEELRQARQQREQMQASLEADRSRDRGASDRLFAAESALDTRTLQLQALQAEIASREDRLSDLLSRTEASINVAASSEEDLLDRLTRVLAVLETRQRATGASVFLNSSETNTPTSTTAVVPPDRTTAEPEAALPITEAARSVPSGDVRNTVTQWASAWSSQDVERYLSFYSERFRPPGGTTRSDWLATRRLRVSRPSQISVSVTDLEIVELSPVQVHALFEQDYSASNFVDRVRKRLEMELEGATWKIIREVSLPLR